ncbi:killer cell lectin-like receptor subfamily B member 1B allele A [Ornithorhynchus anatinus]|uniref:killer cell lectin-like receptor subfamily B member 1B allele A n=1 Tax=Ornithorhynchus anatinus TaxID=9258 RepID=UPI0019D4955A|nr:killer cell lectin-like receptor subfamily B member 1B allele A [Ornithorhynchus anatinus]
MASSIKEMRKKGKQVVERERFPETKHWKKELKQGAKPDLQYSHMIWLKKTCLHMCYQLPSSSDSGTLLRFIFSTSFLFYVQKDWGLSPFFPKGLSQTKIVADCRVILEHAHICSGAEQQSLGTLIWISLSWGKWCHGRLRPSACHWIPGVPVLLVPCGHKSGPLLQFPPERLLQTDSRSSGWRLIAGILGILCLGLVATVTPLAFETLSNQEPNNTSSSYSNTTSPNECHCGPCPVNWMNYRNTCYFASVENKTWQDSHKACVSLNSSLVKIDSKEELDFFNSLYLYHWIGLNRSQNAGSWQWTDGSLLSSGLFDINQKSSGGDCIAYGSRTSGHAENCTTVKNYICESRRR